MDNFPKSEYYLVKIFRKVRCPFLVWPLFIIIIFVIGDYLTYPNFKKDSVLLLIGNAFFSISALFLTVIIYEQNTTAIYKWLNKYKLVCANNDGAIDKLNEIHEYLFNRALLLVPVLVVLIRRLIANKLIINEPITNELIINGLNTNENY